MGGAEAATRLAVVNLGDLLSVRGTVATLFQSYVAAFTPVFLEELACSHRVLTSPESCLFVTARTAFLLASLALLETSCSSTAL